MPGQARCTQHNAVENSCQPGIFNFDDSLFSGRRKKHRLSRSKKRSNHHRHAEQARDTVRKLDLSRDDVRELQRTDSTVEAAQKSESGMAGPGFFQRDGVL